MRLLESVGGCIHVLPTTHIPSLHHPYGKKHQGSEGHHSPFWVPGHYVPFHLSMSLPHLTGTLSERKKAEGGRLGPHTSRWPQEKYSDWSVFPLPPRNTITDGVCQAWSKVLVQHQPFPVLDPSFQKRKDNSRHLHITAHTLLSSSLWVLRSPWVWVQGQWAFSGLRKFLLTKVCRTQSQGLGGCAPKSARGGGDSPTGQSFVPPCCLSLSGPAGAFSLRPYTHSGPLDHSARVLGDN